jgi:hypothetical protein
VRKRQLETVGTRLGEHVIEGLRQVEVVLELVEVEIEVGPPALRPFGSTQCRLP